MIDYDKVRMIVLSNFALTGKENNTRFRVSSASLCRAANVSYLTDEFFRNFDIVMGRNGYSTFRVGNNVAIIKSDTTTGWTRVKLNAFENYEEGEDNG